MARVNIENIIDHLKTEIRKALKEAVENEISDADFDPNQLFREFQRAVRRKCNTWERVPSNSVK